MQSHLLGMAACAAMLIAPLAHAAHDTGHRPNITISKAAGTGAVNAGLFNDAPVTAPAAAAMTRIAGGADIVPSEQYDEKYALTLKDMLGDVPGVFAEQRYAEEVRLSIRGSGLGRNFHLRGIRLLQDGVPITLADGSGDFTEIDPLMVRYTEVYKGANALRYGAANLGGAINLVTPTGRTAATSNLLRLEGGSFGTTRVYGRVARVLDESDLHAGFTAARSEGWREQSNQINGRFSANAGHRFNERLETRFYFTYNNLNQQVPGTLTLAQALNTPQMAPAVNKFNDYARDIRSVRFANKTSYTRDNGNALEGGGGLSFRSLFHPIFQVLDQEQATYTGFARYLGSAELGGHRNDYVLGLNIERGTIDAEQFINAGGSRGTRTGSSDQRAGNYDLYGENQFFVTPEVALVAGGQLLYATRDFTNRLNAAANDAENYAAFSPKAGFLWDVARAAQLFGNISRSYEVPTFSELVQGGVVGFVPLETQKAWTAEVGTRGRHGRFSWDAAYYHAWIEDELLSFTLEPGIPASTFNAGDTRHQGIELGGDVDLGTGWLAHDRLFLRQTYAYSDFSFSNDRQFGNNIIAGVPEHLYRATLRYENHAGFYISPNMEWAPLGGFVDHANTLQAPGYVTFGLTAGYDFGNGAELFIDARNLTDERYVATFNTLADARTASNAVFYPGEGAAVFAGVKYGF